MRFAAFAKTASYVYVNERLSAKSSENPPFLSRNDGEYTTIGRLAPIVAEVTHFAVLWKKPIAGR